MELRTTMYLALVLQALALSRGYAENRPEGTAPPIKDYVAVHYTELQNDLHKGDGVNLTSLLSMLHTPEDEKDQTIKRMRALLVAYPAPAEFAERVPDLAHKDQAPAVPAASAVNATDLKELFGHMKYGTRIHLSMMNGDEVDGAFTSYDQSRETIWVRSVSSGTLFGRKAYALRKMEKVSLIHDESSPPQN